MLKIGENASDFTLPDQEGNQHKLSDYKGKKVILYFYPKDMTPGCTIEACSFRDDFAEYKKRGIIILGISGDSVDSHKKFSEKHSLPFTLLADSKKEVSDKYGVYGEKKFLGKTFLGVKRTTYLIDEKGIIRKVYEKVDVGEHSKEILEDINNL